MNNNDKEDIKMKNKRTYLIYLLTVAICILLSNAVFSQEKADQLFEKALYLEETKGELGDAIELYKQILNDPEADETTQAKALLRMGMSYEKLGKNDALNAYELLIKKYPGQTEQVAEAKARLNSLTKEGPSGFTVKEMEFRVTEPFELSPGGTKMLGVKFIKGQNIVVSHLDKDKIDFITNFTWADECYWTFNPIWSPDGNKIAYLTSFSGKEGVIDNNISISDLEGNSEILIKSNTDAFIPEAWMPDGSSILTIKQDANKQQALGLVNVKSGKFKELISLNGNAESYGSSRASACPSPDGKFIVYTDVKPGEKKDLFIISSDGKSSNPLNIYPATDKWPRWSPDGNHIIFLSNRHGSMALWGISVRNGKSFGDAILIREGMGSNYFGNWTKFGLVSWNWVRMMDVFLMDVNSETGEPAGEARQLNYFPTGKNLVPRFSPNGNDFAFLRTENEGGKMKLVVSRNGAKDFKEYELPAGSTPGSLSWLPSGQGIGVGSVLGGNMTLLTLSFKTEQWDKFKIPVEIGFTFIELGGKDLFYYLKNGMPDDHAVILEQNMNTGEKKRVYQHEEIGRTTFMWLKSSKDFTKLAFMNGRYQLYVVDLKSGKEKMLTSEFRGTPCWSPDGDKIMIIGSWKNDENGKSMLMFPISGDKPNIYDLSKFLPDDSEVITQDWSADGSKVVLMLNRGISEHMLYQNIIPTGKK